MAKQINVLMLNYEYPPIGGGAANATYYLLKEFAKTGMINIDLITSNQENKKEINRLSDNITIHKLPLKKKSLHYWTQGEVILSTYRSYFYARKLLRQKKYNLCHAFFGIPGGLIAYFLRKRQPYIVSLRGSDVPGFNKRFSMQYIVLKPLVRRIWSKAAKVVANSMGLKDLALQTSPKQKIDIIYNGVDTAEFSPAASKKNGLHILCVSRLIERKGIDTLIKAIPLIKQELGRNIKVTIVGKGNLENQLKSLSETLDIGKIVDFAGYIEHDKLVGYYRQADVFILPSNNEGMSNTILEAMASGLPVITTNTGGTSELLKNNGIIIEKANEMGVCRAVVNILSNKKLLSQYAAASLELAKDYSWQNSACLYVDIYQTQLPVS